MRRLFADWLLTLPFLAVPGCRSSGESGELAASPAGHLDGGGGASAPRDCSTSELAALEQQIGAALDGAALQATITTTPDFILLVSADDGRSLSHVHGNSGPQAAYESASTSKLVSAVIILTLVDRGLLSLETKASELLSFWPEGDISLRHLLSFTSGLSDEPLCLNLPNGNFEGCVENIYRQNDTGSITPGSEFYYASTHLQVAGLMAIVASGTASWSELFADFKGRTGLFPNGSFDLPSERNPRLAGGMHWNAEEYLEFLRALRDGRLLSAPLQGQLFANQRGAARVVYSPALGTNERGLGEDWAYGLGNWLECPTANSAGSYDCGERHRNSSPGAYGAYPFLDFDRGYVGILARQGSLGTYPEGVLLFRTVEALVGDWAERRCGASSLVPPT